MDCRAVRISELARGAAISYLSKHWLLTNLKSVRSYGYASFNSAQSGPLSGTSPPHLAFPKPTYGRTLHCFRQRRRSLHDFRPVWIRKPTTQQICWGPL